MKILITGATGLVGSEIVRLCRERNLPVNYLTTSKSKIVSKEGFNGFYWDPRESEIDLNCFDGVTAIINLAGASISKRWTPIYKKEILLSRVHSLRTLYSALKKIDISTISSFVSASAIGIYPSSLSNFYNEDNQMIDDSFLGEIVEQWEREIDQFKCFDINLAKIRIGLVMSEKGGALPEMAKPIQNYVGAAFGSGLQWQSWIHINDLASMFLFVLEHQMQGIFNGVSPNPVSNSKLVKEIARVLKKPLFLPKVPEIIMKAILGEMAYLLFASQRVSSKKIEKEGFIFKHSNIGSALESIYLK